MKIRLHPTGSERTNSYVSSFLARDLVEHRERYFFARADTDLLHDFLEARQEFRWWLSRSVPPARECPSLPTSLRELLWVPDWMRNSSIGQDDLEVLLKRFSVTKRVWNQYGRDWRPIPASRYDLSSNYVAFGWLVAKALTDTSDLRYLNALLQVHDILQSRHRLIDSECRSIVLATLGVEMSALTALIPTGAS